MGPTNPILDELANLSPAAQAALVQAHGAATNPTTQPATPAPAAPAPMQAPGAQAPVAKMAPLVPQQHAADTAPAPPVTVAPMAAPTPSMGTPAMPNVTAPRGTVQGDENEQGRLLSSGSGISQIAGKVENTGFGQKHPFLGKLLGGTAQGIATLGDALLAPAIPGVLDKLPGTEEHHNVLVKKDQSQLTQDEADAEKEAQTRNLDVAPQLREAQLELNQNKLDEKQRNDQDKLQATLAQHGYAVDEANPGQIRPLRYDEMSPTQQAVSDLKSAQQEQAEAETALKKAQNDPSSPVYRQAQARIEVAKQNASIAIQRLGLSEQEFGFNQDKFYSPQPTATERKTGDLAQSAVNQVQTMRQIVQAHPEVFGPAAGRSMTAQAWLGSQSPDAQRFLSASRYLADHSAGVFGSRSVEITKSLEQLTDPKMNPEALNASLDQAEKTAQHFVDAGTLHEKPGGAKPGEGDGGGAPEGFKVQMPDGSTRVKQGGKWVKG